MKWRQRPLEGVARGPVGIFGVKFRFQERERAKCVLILLLMRRKSSLWVLGSGHRLVRVSSLNLSLAHSQNCNNRHPGSSSNKLIQLRRGLSRRTKLVVAIEGGG